jgi:hypothetical protein
MPTIVLKKCTLKKWYDVSHTSFQYNGQYETMY